MSKIAYAAMTWFGTPAAPLWSKVAAVGLVIQTCPIVAVLLM
ncbi:hypothetical protein ACIBG4_41675 [Nonomuraea sp. NPDC050383]